MLTILLAAYIQYKYVLKAPFYILRKLTFAIALQILCNSCLHESLLYYLQAKRIHKLSVQTASIIMAKSSYIQPAFPGYSMLLIMEHGPITRAIVTRIQHKVRLIRPQNLLREIQRKCPDARFFVCHENVVAHMAYFSARIITLSKNQTDMQHLVKFLR